MFEFLSSLYANNGDYINGVASTISILGAFFWLRGHKERKKKKLFFQWVREERIKTNLPKGFDITISNGEAKGHSLVTDVITLLNNTDVVLTDEDFAKPIAIPKKNKNTVFSSIVIDSNNGSHAMLSDQQEAIILSDVYIPRGNSLTIYVAHDSAIQKHLHGDLKNLPSLAAKKYLRPSDTWQFGLVSIVLVLASFILIFQYFPPLDGSESASLGYKVFRTVTPIFIFLASIPILMDVLPRKLDPYLRRFFGISKEEYLHTSETVTFECEAKIKD
ncbi:hypothetical protein [Ruegeria sp. HKCCD6428]|uniref:hypothetical protein n=1 Tax=Ruegeria sp. HKCCD6428 TaxID=2683002 RepID=UPI001492981A|nr:hypothetical protein [Ruegeria sp. HKCCD6428]NOC81868.1 hypothetical protein [Ruegeria sp. HKCCD6428]